MSCVPSKLSSYVPMISSAPPPAAGRPGGLGRGAAATRAVVGGRAPAGGRVVVGGRPGRVVRGFAGGGGAGRRRRARRLVAVAVVRIGRTATQHNCQTDRSSSHLLPSSRLMGLAAGRSSGLRATGPGSPGVLLVAASQARSPVPSMTGATFVPAYRCGTAADFHRVPSHVTMMVNLQHVALIREPVRCQPSLVALWRTTAIVIGVYAASAVAAAIAADTVLEIADKEGLLEHLSPRRAARRHRRVGLSGADPSPRRCHRGGRDDDRRPRRGARLGGLVRRDRGGRRDRPRQLPQQLGRRVLSRLRPARRRVLRSTVHALLRARPEPRPQLRLRRRWCRCRRVDLRRSDLGARDR